MRKEAGSRGFSMIELVIAVGVMLVVAAIATPSVMRSIRAYRVGAVATDVANFIQRTRYEAIRRNTVTTSRAQIANNQWQVWIDYNNDTVVDANEPFILLPADMAFIGSGSVPSTASMGYPTTRLIAGSISFDSRGTLSFGGAAPAVMLTFVGNPNDPSAGYRAVAVTPSGKTKVWRSTGSTWQ